MWVLIDAGQILVTQEKPREPDFVAVLGLPTLAAIATGRLTPADTRAGLAFARGAIGSGR